MNQPLRAVLAVAVLFAAPTTDERASAQPKPWCAKARPQEPLMKDAIRVGTANDERSALDRKLYRIAQVPRESIAMINDDAVCRQAAGAYFAILRKSVDSTKQDKPVIVIRVGKVYFVDDLRSRQGPAAIWEAMVFDEKWRRLWGYGAGA
jgi:hypothetical protein